MRTLVETLVSVGVCTFRRPQHLAATLASLARLQPPPGMTIEIVVADNDALPSAKPAVDGFRAASPWDVVYVHCPAGNISLARNACLDAASGAFLAFIDDDETATPDWLEKLMLAMGARNAAAVLGPVKAHYRPDAPAWMRERDFHSTYPVFVAGTIRTGYTCNVLLDRRSALIAALRFNLARGRSGGEDTEYFARIFAAGETIAFAADAWVHEDVPEARARWRWLARRRFRMGQTHGSLLRERRSGTVMPALAAAAKAGACFAMGGLKAFSPAASRHETLRGVLHVGTVLGLFGVREIAQYGGAEETHVHTA